MDKPAITRVCPHCSASTLVRTDADAAACPKCGQPLAADGDKGDAVPPDVAGADGALIVDLREAFGIGADAAVPGRQPADVFGPLLGTQDLCAGKRLGDFEILAELGRGGMGIVYRARQVSLQREVALKVLPGYARHGRLAVQRFRAEAQAAARLHHTNIVAVYAQGEQDGQFYYAMELVEGVGLDVVIHSRPDLLSSTRVRSSSSGARLASGPVARASGSSAGVGAAGLDVPTRTPDEGAPRPAHNVVWTRADYRHLAALISEVADALECAHQNGVIHRDVKPHNLLFSANNRLHLTDFGLARLTADPHLTSSGEIMGTPAYLSPEQVRADVGKIDHRTDIYSLGVTLYELLTRRKPFGGQTREQILRGICTAEPVAPRRLDPAIPKDLETICLRAMEKDPPRRYATAALLADDLQRFAEGRPILARRTTRVEKTVKWVRRHKALTAALAATVAVVVLAGGLTWSVQAGRQREARELLRQAYEYLAYVDYRTPDVVAKQIERAEALGADPGELHRVQALASVGSDPVGSIRHLQALLQQVPDDVRAQYLLAWVRGRDGDRAGAQATRAQAEQRGAPTAADAWFFRGLAWHYDDPQIAIDCYRQANALRAYEHAFYPQAVLHLARARNQQLYATRSLEPFPEAEESLRQLVAQKQYGAYPYYLLSIGHRLAAEIYRGSTGTRDEALVAEHYAQALDWARRGQDVDGLDDRPIVAEAECLESEGRLDEAISARTRALAVATGDLKRWEGYHYRWRLYYWTDALDSALADVATCASFDRQDRFYAHVYPALILAEAGRMPEALAHARALAADAPSSAQAVLWSATCLRLLGQGAEARGLLAERAERVDFGAELAPPQSQEWVRALYAYCQDAAGSLAPLETLATQVVTPWKLWGEAYFHAAAARLADGDRAGALDGFHRAYRSFDGERGYTFHARLLHGKMRANLLWPPWIAVVSWDEMRDSRDGWVSP